MKKIFFATLSFILSILLIIYIFYAYSKDRVNLILNIPGIISWIIMIFMSIDKIKPEIKFKLNLFCFKIINPGIKIKYSARYNFENEFNDIKKIQEELSKKYSLLKFSSTNNYDYHIQFDTMDFNLALSSDKNELFFEYRFIELGYRDLKLKLEELNTFFYTIESILNPKSKNYSSCIKFKKNPFILLTNSKKIKKIRLDLDCGYITDDCIFINNDNINEQNNNIVKNLLL